MSGQPWETHDPLCPNRRPTIAFPNSACSGCRAVVAARAEGYARGLIEGDHGGRREGYRSGYDTAWSLSAAEIERKALEAARDAVAALPKGGMGLRAHELWRSALAAIDALKGASND